MWPLKVSRSATAAARRGSVNVDPHSTGTGIRSRGLIGPATRGNALLSRVVVLQGALEHCEVTPSFLRCYQGGRDGPVQIQAGAGRHGSGGGQRDGAGSVGVPGWMRGGVHRLAGRTRVQSGHDREWLGGVGAVSYTHLTLPTIYSV